MFLSSPRPSLATTTTTTTQVAAFCAPLQREVHHYQVRVYFLNKTPCALQWAIQNEAGFGFRLACPERTWLLQGSGEDVQLAVGYVSRGWRAVRGERHDGGGGGGEGGGEEEEGGSVSYHAVWHGKCPHLAFCFRSVSAWFGSFSACFRSFSACFR